MGNKYKESFIQLVGLTILRPLLLISLKSTLEGRLP